MAGLSSSADKATLAVVLVLGLAICERLQAQPTNLVLNGNFETRTYCPNNGDLNYCSAWGVHHGSPDYFHRCTSGIWGVPSNVFGYQEPINESDSAYAGITTFTDFFEGGQESLRGNLSEPLMAGMKYKVRMKVAIADSNTNYTSCCIGVAFTQPPLPPYSANHTDVELIIPEEEIDLSAWYQLDGTYIAQGGEDRIYIGSFRPDVDCNPVVIGDTSILTANSAYFYIDDVEVYEDDTITDTEMVEVMRIRAWHHDGQIMLRGMPTGAVAVLYDMAGRAVASGQGEMPAHGLSGLYVLRVMDAQGSVLHVQKLAVGP